MEMVRMNWDVHTHVSPTCLRARMESAFHLIGVVTSNVIALMVVMKKDAVSIIDVLIFLTMVVHFVLMLHVFTAELLQRL